MIVATISEKMDKSDVDSLASVTIKDEPGLTLSRAYSISSEPPPVYKKHVNTSIRIARLIAATVVAVALILGASIILAAYLQTRSTSATTTVTASETTHVVNAVIPTLNSNQTHSASALTADAPEDSSAESTESPSDDDDKDHRRLDTEEDLLEAFLENEGKILRLPTDDDNDLDIDDLAKMFLERNQPEKTKCFVERRPMGEAAEELIKMFPIQNNGSSPIVTRVSGERVSIICNSDSSDVPSDNRPLSLPLAMPTPMMLTAPMTMPLRMNSIVGPFPVLIKDNDVPMSIRNFQRPMTGLSSPFFIPQQRFSNNDVDRNMNLPPLRNMFQPERGIPSNTPFRFPVSNVPMRPFNTLGMPFPQIQARSSFHSNPTFNPAFKFPTPVNPSNPPDFLQASSPFNIAEQNLLSQRRFNGPSQPNFPTRPPPSPMDQGIHMPFARIPQRPIHVPIFNIPERRMNPVTPDTSEESDESDEDLLFNPAIPLFRVPKPVLTTPAPTPSENKILAGVLTPPAEDDDIPRPLPIRIATVQNVPMSARPITLPFLQVPSNRVPILSPPSRGFPGVLNATPSAAPKQDSHPPSPIAFLERLMSTLLTPGSRPNQRLMIVTPSSVTHDEPSLKPSIRSGNPDARGPLIARGLRFDDPVIGQNRSPMVARPVAGVSPDQKPAASSSSLLGEEKSHFIQPRSLTEK